MVSFRSGFVLGLLVLVGLITLLRFASDSTTEMFAAVEIKVDSKAAKRDVESAFASISSSMSRNNSVLHQTVQDVTDKVARLQHELDAQQDTLSKKYEDQSSAAAMLVAQAEARLGAQMQNYNFAKQSDLEDQRRTSDEKVEQLNAKLAELLEEVKSRSSAVAPAGHEATDAIMAAVAEQQIAQAEVQAPTDEPLADASAALPGAADPCTTSGLASVECVRYKLEYWKARPKLTPEQILETFPREPGIAEPKYVTHEIDLGGFNNIRQGFEMVLACVLLTGRTFVLPPPRGWYLINWGPQTRGRKDDGRPGWDSVSRFEDFFDLEQLKKFIPVITTAEFLELERERLNIPAEFTAESVAHGFTTEKYDRWLRDQPFTKMLTHWNPNKYVVCWPSVAAACSQEKLDKLPEGGRVFVNNRRMVEHTQEEMDATVLHFPMDNDKAWRYLGQVATLVLFESAAQDRTWKAFYRDATVYVPAVYDIASRIIAGLGGFGTYAALHVRRNDIFKDVHIPGAKTAENIANVLQPGEKLYMSTDEMSKGFFDVLSHDAGGERQVLRWHDFVKAGGAVDPGEVSYRLQGLIEQVVCAGSRIFIGTWLSTFSGFIGRLRGYMDAAEKMLYFHTTFQKGLKEYKPWTTSTEYMHEMSTMWEDV